MKTTTTITWQQETIDAAEKASPRVVSGADHIFGMAQAEPLIVAMDSMIRYAKAYSVRFDGDKLAEDRVLGDRWLDAVKSIRGLLDGDGAAAMETGRSTDSKDNGAVEAMFWAAIDAAGYTEETANL